MLKRLQVLTVNPTEVQTGYLSNTLVGLYPSCAQSLHVDRGIAKTSVMQIRKQFHRPL
jgi:hypothetical protein